jgi:hypothetical protein
MHPRDADAVKQSRRKRKTTPNVCGKEMDVWCIHNLHAERIAEDGAPVWNLRLCRPRQGGERVAYVP